MANWTESESKRERNVKDNGKFILDFAAYPSFRNIRSTRDKQLTKEVRVNSANGQFIPTHRTTIPVQKRRRVTNVPALLHDGLKQKLLATHDIIEKVAPIILMKDSARLMKNNKMNKWLKERSTKIDDKINNICIVDNDSPTKTDRKAYAAIGLTPTATTDIAPDQVSEAAARRVER